MLSRTLRSTLAVAALAFAACGTHRPDDDLVAATHRLLPSVVLLTMDVPDETKRGAVSGEYATGTIVASGAWGSDVLTVQHAVDRAWNVRVTVNNRRKYPAIVVAQNADLDIALVRMHLPNLPAAPLGSVKDAQPGRDVGLLGYPIPDQFDQEGLGLATSLGAGRVASIRENAVEVTLPIVPGESGGPVFLADTGEIIGMAESRFGEEHSIGFALPVDDAKNFLHKYDAAHGF